MSSVVIAGDTSGTITLAAPLVAGSGTLTLPVATDTLVGKATTDTLTNKTLVNPTITDLQSLNAPNTFGFKNRIINGGMVIDQRNAGASVTPTANAYTLDRWYAAMSQASKYSVQQTATAPEGFINSLKVTSLSAYTVGASEYFQITQQIEGLNVSDLGWGTANAKTVTLSFQVYSSLTGTFGGAIANGAFNRSYPFSYSIPVANTWTTISITIAGDTSGTWLTTNGIGIYTMFSLGSGATVSGTSGAWVGGGYRSATGAVSVVGTSGATFYITGVQLEKGSTATSFDFRDYGRELAMCQRYYYRITNVLYGFGQTYWTTGGNILTQFPVPMRAAPSGLGQSGTAGHYAMWTANGAQNICTAVPTFSSASMFNAITNGTVASGATVGGAAGLYGVSGLSYLDWSTEL